MIRVLPLLVAAAVCALPLAANSTEVLSFVQKSCAGCHNATVKSGDIDLKALLDANHGAKTFDENREIWEKVVEKLKTGTDASARHSAPARRGPPPRSPVGWNPNSRGRTARSSPMPAA